MKHSLEVKYGLTAVELLDAIERRFRLKVALEGAVAEVQFERKLRLACKEGWLTSFESHDADGVHDFTIETRQSALMRVEVKTVRKGSKPKVELEKTRTSLDDPASRFYDRSHFDIVAVNIGRLTGNWEDFRYALVREMPSHQKHPGKLRVMHAIEEVNPFGTRWFSRFQDVMDAY